MSYKEFGEKLNTLIKEICAMYFIDNLKDLMIYISKNVKSVFASENVHLWMLDSVIILLILIVIKIIIYKKYFYIIII